MRRKIFGILVALLVVGVSSVLSGDEARADGGPHVRGQGMTTDACAGCHRAHTAKAADLLKVSEALLCETCHDGSQATTNVKAGMSTTGGALRGGGFDTAAINTTDDSWRFSVQCAGGPTLPGYPLVPCSGTTRITFCGTGAAIPNPPTICNLPGGGGYTAPGSWDLHISTLGTPATVTSSHTLGAAGTAWGNGLVGAGAGFAVPVNKLECSSCHDPHGNGQYRVLRTNPATTVGATDTFSGGVTVPDACPAGSSTSCIADVPAGLGGVPAAVVGNLHSYTTDNYMNATYVEWTTGWAANATTGSSTGPFLDGGAPGSTTAAIGISAWCSQCHSRYLARGAYGTASGDAIFAFRHSSEGTLSYNGRQCNTCHVAHGTNATMTGFAANSGVPGGAVDSHGASIGASSSSLLKMDNRGICLKCHKR